MGGPLLEGEEVGEVEGDSTGRPTTRPLSSGRRGGDVEQFVGTAISGSGRGDEPPTGCPTPVTLDKLEGCFDSLASADINGKDTLD